MALRSALSRNRSTFTVEGVRVRLRCPQATDYLQWATVRDESREHLVPWEPTWAPDELSRESWRRRLRRYQQAERDGAAHMFFIFSGISNDLVGGLQLSNIRQGIAQSAATMGYWIGQRYAGQGLMSDAVTAALRHGFGRLGFHRIEAACLPSNTASRRVLQKCGFTAEGTARKYLRINGEWQDHLLFAIIAEDPIPTPKFRD
jgi:[ribosomal protein S5]-alanine N-acetyltransferase